MDKEGRTWKFVHPLGGKMDDETSDHNEEQEKEVNSTQGRFLR
jgi:hypothetical protein